MSDHPIDPRDVPISLVAAALEGAEADTAAPDSGLIFRSECKRAPAEQSAIQIIAHENSNVSCQMWSFNDKFDQLEDAQIYPDDHKCAKLAAEMKKLIDKHSSEMKNLKEEMAAAIAAMRKALKEEMAEAIAAMRKALKEEMAEAIAPMGKALKELEAERTKMEEATDRKWLPSRRAQICHWESFSSTFRSASFDPVPITYGLLHLGNAPSYIVPCRAY
ncbi:hypothetical protein C8R45DRAFT_1011430 [Mycena sanguinolenta]|nr:hypothetical protein C8R45DRAFT_1011430 [Mycena sanguinolenta]